MLSQNNWPALEQDSSKLFTWTVPGDGTKLRLRNGSAGFLLIHLATRFDRKVEDLTGGILDDWGYAYRPIRGYTTTMSNHSSGTAIDLNATQHPLGADNTFTDEEEEKINRLLRKYDGCIRWGGNYKYRVDEMHFEIDRPLRACEKVARRLMSSNRGKKVLRANPGQRRVILS
ncbi:MAG: M15 family peptidase [Phage AS32]|nr:MAG: M15 family peptidase [Phage AS32]